MAKTSRESILKSSSPSRLTRRGKSAKPRDKQLKHKCMMNTIIMGLPTCRHPHEAEAEVGGGVILTLLTITAMKTIMITMDTTTTTTGAATMTHTMATMTSRGLGEDE